jgi:circadian clock protein KaiB
MAKKAKKNPAGTTADYEAALTKADAQMYVLRLCVSGMTPRSSQALINLKQICEDYLEGHYQLEVIDLYQEPALAAAHQIIATPTLLKEFPPPLRRLIGDLSDTNATLQRLGITTFKGGDA